jgi:hypothetical protein
MTPHEPILYATYRSEHFTYRSLWHAAVLLRERGERDEDQGFWSILAGTLLAFTAFEGFVNELIESIAPDVWKKERTFFGSGTYRGTMGKTHFLGDRTGLELDLTTRPYTTVAELCAWRNDLVHPRTARIKREAPASAEQKHAKPAAFKKLERRTFVSRGFEDLPSLSDALLDAAREQSAHDVRHLGSLALWGPVGSGHISLK